MLNHGRLEKFILTVSSLIGSYYLGVNAIPTVKRKGMRVGGYINFR